MASLSPQTLLSLSLSLKTQFDTLLYLQFPPLKTFPKPHFLEKQTEEPTTTQQLGVVLGGSRRVRCDPSAEPGHYGYARGYGGGSRGRWLGFGGQVSQVGGFSDGTLSFEGFSSATSSSSSIGDGGEIEDTEKLIDRSINATIVLAAGTFAITKLLAIDQDYWLGWTIFEILRYAPQHNWSAYEEALKTNPVLAKMMISGVVYSLGDWIAQCYTAMKAYLSLSLTVHGCLDQVLLVSPYMVPFLITITNFVSFFLPKTGGWFLPK